MGELARFIEAQDHEETGLAAALAELRTGRKHGHWIWYVFPQLAGLGSSAASQRYALAGREEAVDYLRHDGLRDRLLAAMSVVSDQFCRLQPPRLEDLMGSRVDALKLVSSMTLFERVAEDLAARDPDGIMARLAEQAGEILAVAESQGYERCAFTRERLDAPADPASARP